MSSYGRRHVEPYGAMYRAVSYDSSGTPLRAAGPYAGQGAAKAARHGLLRGKAASVRVEVCLPHWEPVEETELWAS